MPRDGDEWTAVQPKRHRKPSHKKRNGSGEHNHANGSGFDLEHRNGGLATKGLGNHSKRDSAHGSRESLHDAATKDVLGHVNWKGVHDVKAKVLNGTAHPVAEGISSYEAISSRLVDMYQHSYDWSWTHINEAQRFTGNARDLAMSAPTKVHDLVTQDLYKQALEVRDFAQNTVSETYEQYQRDGLVSTALATTQSGITFMATTTRNVTTAAWDFFWNASETLCSTSLNTASAVKDAIVTYSYRAVEGTRDTVVRIAVIPASFLPPTIFQRSAGSDTERTAETVGGEPTIASRTLEVVEGAVGAGVDIYKEYVGPIELPVLGMKVETVVGRAYTEVATRAPALDFFPHLKID